jgi:hypothetical protein
MKPMPPEVKIGELAISEAQWFVWCVAGPDGGSAISGQEQTLTAIFLLPLPEKSSLLDPVARPSRQKQAVGLSVEQCRTVFVFPAFDLHHDTIARYGYLRAGLSHRDAQAAIGPFHPFPTHQVYLFWTKRREPRGEGSPALMTSSGGCAAGVGVEVATGAGVGVVASGCTAGPRHQS